MRKILVVLSLLFLKSIDAKINEPIHATERHTLINPYQLPNQIEYFLAKPSGEGPFPVMFLLTGYQPPENSLGGKELVNFGYLDRFVNEGIVAISISVPGFGKSDGERDFSGPSSQKAILAVIDHCKKLSFIDPEKMGIYGISRGATLAGMISAICPDLKLQILESGEYDLTSGRSNLPDYLFSLRKNLLQESGGTLEAFMERSCLFHTDTMKQETLLLHGEFDNRKGLSSAVSLHEKLIAHGLSSYLQIYPEGLHILGPEKWELVIPFVREQFFDIGGIGINVKEIGNVLQIAKVHPNSPAARSCKIRVGDAILSMAEPGKESISAIEMKVQEFISLVLGKKGTPIILKVQHFDNSLEEVVLERGIF